MTYAIIAPRWWWILFLIVLVATDDSMVCGFAVVRQPPNYHWSSLWDEGMTTRTTMHQRRWRVHRMTMTTNENSKSENATNAASIKSIATTKNSGSSNLKKEKNDDIKISLPPPEQVIGTKPSMVDIKTTTTKALRSSSFTLSSPPSSSTTTKKNLKIFPRYLEVECWKRQELRGLEPVLQAVAEACQQITRIVQRAQTDDMYGVAAATSSSNEPMENIQGEIQQKLDVLCNTIMMRTFCGSSRDTIQLIASEEEDLPRCCSDVMVCFM